MAMSCPDVSHAPPSSLCGTPHGAVGQLGLKAYQLHGWSSSSVAPEATG